MLRGAEARSVRIPRRVGDEIPNGSHAISNVRFGKISQVVRDDVNRVEVGRAFKEEWKISLISCKLSDMTAQQYTEQVSPLPPEAQRQIDDFIAFIHQKYAPAALPQESSALEDEPCFGMWSDRDDMADSTAYVRELRRKQWGDNS